MVERDGQLMIDNLQYFERAYYALLYSLLEEVIHALDFVCGIGDKVSRLSFGIRTI
jgi:hypothetical protein